MYRTILVPTDGSDGAAEAAEAALSLASGFDAAVHALYVIDERFVEGHYDLVVEEAEAAAEAALDHVGRRGGEAGVDVEKHLRRGIPHEEILDAVGDHDVDLVVMGTHGRTGLDRLLHLGSTAERVVRASPVEVLTVPVGRAADEESA